MSDSIRIPEPVAAAGPASTGFDGRAMRKLRVSVTSRCDLRCVYCDDPGKLRGGDSELDPAEIARLVGILAEQGIDEIRLTGGEPLVRRDLGEILVALESVLVSKGITTNGQNLDHWARPLADSGFARVNVSLDSLDQEVYRRITGGGSLARVLDGIDSARAQGALVKINCVVLAGINDGEIEAFHDFSAKTGLEVRFLELLPAGPAQALLARRLVVAATILERLEAHAGALSDLPAAADSTAFRRSTEAGAVLGFVAGQSRPFCATCSRLRLSSSGRLHACLFREDGVSLRGKSAQEIAILVSRTMASKPLLRSAGIDRSLGALGG